MKRIVLSPAMPMIAMLVWSVMLAAPALSSDRASDGDAATPESAAAVPRTMEEALARLKKIAGVDVDFRPTKGGSLFESRREIVVGCLNWDQMPCAFFVVPALPTDKEGARPADFTGATAVETIAAGGRWSVVADPNYDPEMAGKILAALGMTASPEAESRRLKQSAANWLDLRLAVVQDSDPKAGNLRPLTNGPTAAQIDEYSRLFSDSGYNAGRRRGDPYLWYHVLRSCEVPANLVTTADRRDAYVLLSDKPDEVLLSRSIHPRPWHLKRVDAVRDAEDRPAVELEFDDLAAERFARLTAANPGRALALLFNDGVMHVQAIDGKQRGTLIVSRKGLDESFAAGMVRALRECMIETAVVADDSDSKSSRAADGATTVETKVHELKVVEKALKPIFEAVEPRIKIEYRDQTLEATHLTQKFKIHQRNKRGDFSETAHDEIGPSSTGFVLRAHLQPRGEVNQAVTPQTIREPYWVTDLGVTPIGKTDKQILWSLSYGSRADKELLDKIRQALKGLKVEASGGR
jgi:hypothetical protein